MGDANKRGSREVRVAQGIAKHEEAARERAKREAEYEASLTLEQKAKRRKARTLLTGMIGLAASMNTR